MAPRIPIKRVPKGYSSNPLQKGLNALLRPKERMRENLREIIALPALPDDPFQDEVSAPQGIETASFLPSEVSELADSAHAERFYDIHRDGVTQGFFEKLLACPHRAHLAYEQGLEQDGFRYPMEFGNIAHAALDHVYSTYRDNPKHPAREALAVASMDGALAADELFRRADWRERSFAGEAEEGLNLAYSLMPALLRKHFEVHEDLRGGIEWEALEENLSIPYHFRRRDGSPLPYPPVPIRGKIDGRFRDPLRALRFMDHKTKGIIEVEFLMKQLALDPQVLIYNWLITQATGEAPAGMVYNCIRRTQLKFNVNKERLEAFCERVEEDMDKRPEFYFVRFEVAFTPEDTARFERNFAGMMEYALLWSRGMFRYQVGSACQTRYGACGFLDLCSSNNAPDVLKTFQRREHVYPELVELEVPSKGG